MWGIRVVIPPQMRGCVLNELHQSHPVIVRMKSLAGLYVWWPGIDREIEQMVRGCESCNLQRDNVPLAPLHPWEYRRGHGSACILILPGLFFAKMWLIVVDARSKWPEVIYLKEATSGTTITALMSIITRFGCPEVLVTDNGPQFISEQFKTFCKSNGIRHA